ncbi:hypothetical protein Kfla_5007 [Kribbella flavida DSM 17836]|uniref:Aminoglycoside phosphotransferase n=2 Tax=Kribbella flavida TaxID=182640 RepID=D2Q277_KRIFD|nr:hypothetical protein Kfla_5007 [Kribbella flavida DSM 17836]
MPPTPRSLEKDAEGQWVRRWSGADWFAAVDVWVRTELAGAAIAVTGGPVPYKVRFWATVWCYPTDHGLFWFKENNPGQAFEAALVGVMARELPQHVIAPLAVEPVRGWMLTADQGLTLDEQLAGADVDPLPLWRRLVTEYAELQRDTIPAGPALLASGLTAAEPEGLGETVHGIADWFDALAADHPLAVGSLDDVRRAADNLSSWTAKLSGAIPLALDQNDLHARNVFSASPSAPFRFFDFGDALWGHPFVTLSCVQSALVDPDDPGSWTEDDARLQEVKDAYLTQWTDLAPLDLLRAELDVAQPLHVVHRLISWHRLLVHADETEAAAWSLSPHHWLAEVARLFAPT